MGENELGVRAPDRPGEWAAISVDFLDSPEVAGLNPQQVLVFLGGILYATRRLTDGRVPERAWRSITAQLGSNMRAVSALEQAGLVSKPDEHGERELVGYLRWNASRAYRQEQRRKNRERVAAHRARQGNGEHNALHAGLGHKRERESKRNTGGKGLDVDPLRASPRPEESATSEQERDELVGSDPAATVREVTTLAVTTADELGGTPAADLETSEQLGGSRSGSSSAPGEPAPIGPDVERFLAAIRAKAARGG